MNKICRRILLLLLVACVFKPATSYIDPCDSAITLEDDWRHPMEEDVGKCDRQLQTYTWYKFTHGGEPAIIVQEPIREKHCGTTGSISLSSSHPNHAYPPPINHSAIFIFCVHVSIMGVITCLDHLTIALVAMTCSTDDVVYYWETPIMTCPSAFCTSARNDTIDHHYILEPMTSSVYKKVKIHRKKQTRVSELTKQQLNNIATLEFGNNNMTKNVLVSIQNKLKSLLWRAFTEKICASEIKPYINSRDKRNLTVDVTVFLNDSISQVLCQIKKEDIKFVSLQPYCYKIHNRISLYVENFCGYVDSSNLVLTLQWFNSTERLRNITELKDIFAIYTRLPSDQEPVNYELTLNLAPSAWVIIFCSAFLVLTFFLFIIVCFRIQLKFAFVDQKEKIFLVDCEQTHKWMVLSTGVGRSKPLRGRLNTSSSGTKRRNLSSVSSPMMSPTETLKSTERFNLSSLCKIDWVRSKIHSSKSETRITSSSSPGFRSQLLPPALPTTSSSIDCDTSYTSDNSGWIVPLEEFENSILSGSIGFPVPKMVVDKKRRSRRRTIKKDDQELCGIDVVDVDNFKENEDI